METLPTEVFNEILEQFEPAIQDSARTNPWARPRPYKPDHIDSKQHFARLRLVSKRFSELAAPYLFRSIGLRFNLKSFGRLECLAGHPKLARHVKKFVYLMPYLYVEGTRDFDAFRTDRSLRWSNKLRQIMFEEREPFYYPSAYKEQQDVMRGSYDLIVLKKAMKAFVSLQQVQLLSIMVHKDVVLRNLASGFDSWEFIDCRWIPACLHAVEILALALNYGHPPVTALSSPTMSPQSLLQLNPKIRQAGSGVWRQLTYLEVTFDERPDRSYLDITGTNLKGHVSPMATLFKEFFTAAQNLSTLHIRFTPGMPVRLPLKDLFHEITFPKLRVLGIGSWMLRAEEIVDIVHRHRQTLRGLRLGDIYLVESDNEGRWTDVVVALKSYMKELEWVGLQDIGYEGDYHRKQAYIETYSDTSSEEEDVDDDEAPDLDDLSVRSVGSSSHNNNHVYPSHAPPAEDDIIYGNVFTSSEDAIGPPQAGGSTWPSASSSANNHSDGNNMGNADGDGSGIEDDLEDNGRTVSQAQRKHWERWIVGRNVNTGELYTRSL